MDSSLFQFDWENNKGLDLRIIEWQSTVSAQKFDPKVLELGMALYSAFSELRTIMRIQKEGKPGVDHSFYQYQFELFSHNHFLSISVNRVRNILKIAYPSTSEVIEEQYVELIKRVASYRNSLEHQTEISEGKDAPAFFNNLSSTGYESQGNSLAYAEIAELLNSVMARLESNQQ